MIKISDSAKEKIIDVLVSENSNVLRFGLQGGGCNGFQYYFSTESEKEEDDIVYEIDKDKIMIVDVMSHMYLESAEIDYKRDLMGESFVFNNPNTTSKCGCSKSVSFG